MDYLISLNSKRSGRDRLFRLVQYSLKIIQGSKRARYFERQLIAFRKLLRFGTCLDTIYGVKSTLKCEDHFLKAITTISRTCLALYLYYDHLELLTSHGLIEGIL